ncbi:cation/calcium exchanger 4-like [Dorcoceras hygrometricum]|uniref:Cation/calcium exchanger 4-like n=1 Tax=Dorcoceras hygrometricum TaxID=472368 RepID=A0A2Z7CMH2_9LAMI|nr:cation/calcium exchanger 4-like [Dorcoceras hygrometricum]
MEFSTRIYCRKRSKFRAIFNWVCVLVLLCLFAGQEEIFQRLFSKKPFENPSLNPHLENDFLPTSVFRRKVFEHSLNLSIEDGLRNREFEDQNFVLRSGYPTSCSGIYQHRGYTTKCEYLRSNPKCNAGGYIGYLEFFYCDCETVTALGYIVLVIWLLVLFYVLGNTAADYFCCSLEILSNLLRLPPTLSGVTLLPLGNGAPDVFASIASFVGRDSGDVGLNGVLGACVFVTCIVVGAVSFSITGQTVRIDKKCFFRDVGFFIFTLLALLCILLVGKVSIGGAIAFFSIYLVYGLFVAATEILRKYGGRLKLGSVAPLLPVTGSVLSGENDVDQSVYASLLQPDSEDSVPHLKCQVPHCVWPSNETTSSDEHQKKSWGWNEEDSGNDQSWFSCSKLWLLLEFPLMLPRRLTIPIVEEERWSKFFAVASAFFAPVVLAVLWSTSENHLGLAKGIIYIVGFVVGGILGVLALIYTKREHPPRRFLVPWVLGGFFMSIIWFYVIANELVALLVAFGVILGIKSSLLALTILAWGNSLGDLMANVAIAMNGGDGVQVAISGCFAGPMFNTLVGLGLSLLIGAWSKKPSVYVIPRDDTLYFTLGFLLLGLVWSLVVLPRNNMRPGKLLGAGLIIIYSSFLTLRATIAISDGMLN